MKPRDPCRPDCRCPLCDSEMATLAAMKPAQLAVALTQSQARLVSEYRSLRTARAATAPTCTCSRKAKATKKVRSLTANERADLRRRSRMRVVPNSYAAPAPGETVSDEQRQKELEEKLYIDELVGIIAGGPVGATITAEELRGLPLDLLERWAATERDRSTAAATAQATKDRAQARKVPDSYTPAAAALRASHAGAAPTPPERPGSAARNPPDSYAIALANRRGSVA